MNKKRVSFPIAALFFLFPFSVYLFSFPETTWFRTFSIGYFLTLDFYMMIVLFAKNLGSPLLAGTTAFVVSGLIRLINGTLHVFNDDASTYLDLILNIIGNTVHLVGTIVLFRVVSNCIDYLEVNPWGSSSAKRGIRSPILPMILFILSFVIPSINEFNYTSAAWIGELIGCILLAVLYALPWFLLCKWVRDPYVYNPDLAVTVQYQIVRKQESEET